MIHWLTTKPNPYKISLGYDCGQKGWRLHAIESDETTFSGLGRQRTLCGLRPRWGWSLDLFIEKKCARCAKKLGLKRSLSGEWLPERIVNEQEHNQHVQIV